MSHRTTPALVLLTAGALAMTTVTAPAAFAANPHEESQSGTHAPASSIDAQSGAPQSGTDDELRPETWTRLMVAVMRLPVGPDPGILPGSGP